MSPAVGTGFWLRALLLLTLFQTVHLVYSIRRIGSDGLLAVISGYVSIFCLVYVANYACASHASAVIAVNLLLFGLYGVLGAYLLSANGHLDYAVISENYYWASAWSSLKVILGALRWEPLAAALLMGLCLAASSILFPPRWSGTALPIALRGDVCVIAAAVYLLLLVLPYGTHDELMHFLKSLRRYYTKIRPHDAALPAVRLADDEYPFLTRGINYHDIDLLTGDGKATPHIFLIMMESLNAVYLEKLSPEDHVYTPCLNDLLNRGLYVERFYANGVQTAPGQAATLFSLLPALRGNLFNNYRYLNVMSLPSLLREAGYETLFFQADKHLDLENTRPMLQKHGFQRIKRVWDYLEKEDRDFVWGWGPEDHVVYRRFFRYLDDLQEQRSGAGPYFSVLSTINNHMRFDVPENRRLLYRQPVSLRQRYANSLRLADSHLPVFFEELKKRSYLDNALVIITGDHSFPTGDHGIEANEIGFYEESFRTPFLVLWEGRLRPGRIGGTVHSQMDIAPTILDLLKLDVGLNPFQGASIFGGDPGRPVIFIQPYSGVVVGMATPAYKYAKRLSTGEEFLFCLTDDPGEERNLAGTRQADERLAFFRGYLSYVFLNQQLIEHNRIRQ